MVAPVWNTWFLILVWWGFCSLCVSFFCLFCVFFFPPLCPLGHLQNESSKGLYTPRRQFAGMLLYEQGLKPATYRVANVQLKLSCPPLHHRLEKTQLLKCTHFDFEKWNEFQALFTESQFQSSHLTTYIKIFFFPFTQTGFNNMFNPNLNYLV